MFALLTHAGEVHWRQVHLILSWTISLILTIFPGSLGEMSPWRTHLDEKSQQPILMFCPTRKWNELCFSSKFYCQRFVSSKSDQMEIVAIFAILISTCLKLLLAQRPNERKRFHCLVDLLLYLVLGTLEVRYELLAFNWVTALPTKVKYWNWFFLFQRGLWVLSCVTAWTVKINILFNGSFSLSKLSLEQSSSLIGLLLKCQLCSASRTR